MKIRFSWHHYRGHFDDGVELVVDMQSVPRKGDEVFFSRKLMGPQEKAANAERIKFGKDNPYALWMDYTDSKTGTVNLVQRSFVESVKWDLENKTAMIEIGKKPLPMQVSGRK